MFHQTRKPLYRNNSLARLSSPEGLDEMMKVINPKSWLVLIAYISLVITGIIWSIFGHIPITIETKGNLAKIGQIKYIKLLEPGRLQALKVKNGDTFQQGQVLAVINKLASKGTKEIRSEFSGKVLWIAPTAENIDSNNLFAIIEKNDSSLQKSITCSSSSEECQKIKAGMKVQITASEMQEDNYKFNAVVKDVVPLGQNQIIIVLGNEKIDNNTKDKLEKYPSYPVSIRVVTESHPISFILPNSESDNASK